MLCTREVLTQSMLERGSGVILNISSAASFLAIPRKSHYTTAKAALRTFTQAVAAEVGPKGIRCNCVVPGSIDTELWRGYVARSATEEGVDYDTRRSQLVAATAIRDISTTDDVANLVLFLASDESRTITGQSVLCDGGRYMLG
jgi:NAD(P)-dependent dehydrogenase (short-subunit alcohol dehydrogenase family)